MDRIAKIFRTYGKICFEYTRFHHDSQMSYESCPSCKRFACQRSDFIHGYWVYVGRSNAMLSEMNPKIRLLLSVMLFLMVTIFGFVCLLLTGKMVPLV